MESGFFEAEFGRGGDLVGGGWRGWGCHFWVGRESIGYSGGLW